MKKILFSILLLIGYVCPAQVFSAGAGLGMSSNGDVVTLKAQAEFKKFGITSGFHYIFSDEGNPCYFNFEGFKSFYLDKYSKIVPHAGYAYKKIDFNTPKGTEGWRYIYGGSLVFKIFMTEDIGGRVWFDCSYTDKTLIFSIGLRIASNYECR